LGDGRRSRYINNNGKNRRRDETFAAKRFAARRKTREKTKIKSRRGGRITAGKKKDKIV